MKNGVIMQYFEWNLPNDGLLWRKLKKEAKNLHCLGITAVWIPPAYKAFEQKNQGYATYDLFDLGEFDQKGSVRTKYGTKKQLQEAITELHKYHISVYLDAVLNHKIGADHPEKCKAIEVDPENRLIDISEEKEIKAWTGYDFPQRNAHYSSFCWNFNHFNGFELIEKDSKHIYRITGENKYWNKDVDTEKGNFDFLMGTDIDHGHPEVIKELNYWGNWVCNELQLDGMRLDAIKHISSCFMRQFAENIQQNYRDSFYFVGEYWKAEAPTLSNYLTQTDNLIDLFDVPLHYKFYEASLANEKFDLRELFEETLVQHYPTHSVTFVDNHDSQKGSSLESEVEDWFKPHAYASILLSHNGYPCVFYGDYYGINGKASSLRETIDILLKARQKYAYGDEKYFFTSPNTIGFVRLGDKKHADSGLAVLISNSDQKSSIQMNVGRNKSGEKWINLIGKDKQIIEIQKDGNAYFTVSARSISVWVKKQNHNNKLLNVSEALKRIQSGKRK